MRLIRYRVLFNLCEFVREVRGADFALTHASLTIEIAFSFGWNARLCSGVNQAKQFLCHSFHKKAGTGPSFEGGRNAHIETVYENDP